MDVNSMPKCNEFNLTDVNEIILQLQDIIAISNCSHTGT